MTANEIINGAFRLVGIYGQSETPTAADAQDALRRLNNMVSGWRTQSLTTLAVEEYIFNLTADRQQYTIGLGGDFNVPRPQAISGAALLLDGLTSAVSVSITRSGDVATVTSSSHGLTTGQSVLIAGCTDPAYNGLQIVASTPTANTFTYAVFNEPTSPAAGSPTTQTFNGTPVRIPRPVITDSAYQAIQIPTMDNAQFTNVYYNPTQPLGTIWLWPMPDTNENQLVLFLAYQFTGFADLTHDYTFPETAGYAEALEYNLAIRLASSFGVRMDDYPDVREIAKTSLGLIKRQNYKLFDLPTDPALTPTQGGGYNILTGNGS